MTEKDEMPSIEYHGTAGATLDCVEAVEALLHFRPYLAETKILSAGCEHGLLVSTDIGEIVAIKSGFTSGYDGGGPSGFSYVIELLEFHGIRIDEILVTHDLLERLDHCCLTVDDLELLQTDKPVRPHRYMRYVRRDDIRARIDHNIWDRVRPILPLGLIDRRIADLALEFEKSPSDAVLKGFRRLEDFVRKRIDAKDETGARIFSMAFHGEASSLGWENISDSEKTGRANLFVGSFMAHRNPLAHKENELSREEALSQFLLLNHLFHLEKSAIEIEHNTQNGDAST